jgi:hypothetical protein
VYEAKMRLSFPDTKFRFFVRIEKPASLYFERRGVEKGLSGEGKPLCGK